MSSARAADARFVLTVEQMAAADRLALEQVSDSFALMEAAGLAVCSASSARFPEAAGFDVLCGPGSNGGDGYVTARLLRARGLDVAVWSAAETIEGDARRAFETSNLDPQPLAAFQPRPGRVVVDALFGAGLSRPLDGEAARACRRTAEADARVVAVDLPSGLSGNTGKPLDDAFAADLTVTFARKKPAHLLFPGRGLCGDVVVADIGIPDSAIARTSPMLWENGAELWREAFPWPALDAHKYSRGHLAVCSGGPFSSGAARLSARAGARAGAGAVTLLSPADALPVNAVQLTAIMLRGIDTTDAFSRFLGGHRCGAVVLGPGFGALDRARDLALAALAEAPEGPERVRLVLDADGITAFREKPADLFDAAQGGEPRLVLTPHEGEFARLFPDLAEPETLSKVERARKAAQRSHAVVVLKGPDTVIAEPSGRAAVNTNATPFLATAGSGDVLAGVCGALLAQGMPAWEAACAAVWLHAEAGQRFGPGLTADDLPDALLPVLRRLHDGSRSRPRLD